MSSDQPKNLVELIFFVLRGAGKSREVLEAELPEELRVDVEDRLLIDHWVSTVERTGLLLANFAMVPQTKAELVEEMQGLFNRAPAWMDASLEGKPVTYEVFVRGMEQTMAVQRRAFERVIAEQALDPEPIEELLAEAPVLISEPGRLRDRPMVAVGDVSTAHVQALVEIAFDIEAQLTPRSSN